MKWIRKSEVGDYVRKQVKHAENIQRTLQRGRKQP